jgi:branched-chain amino acid transport system substrate-binding protein
MAVSTKLASILIVVFLLIGIVAGYFAGSTAAPPAKTVTVPAGATTVTVTTSITTTRTVATPTTVTVPAVGLQGDILIGALLPLTGVLSSYGGER